MGNTFEVYSYVPTPGGVPGQDYEYKLVYAGEKFEDAMRILCNEKATGVGCCKLEWR
jgi:hypothetical protein